MESIEEIKKLITPDDIREIALASGITETAVRHYLRGEGRRSKCAKYVLARYKKNKEFQF